MAQYKITGGNKLRGEVSISGNKNTILPAIAAALLTEEEVTLRNVPKIRDVEIMLSILRELGVDYELNHDSLLIKAPNISTHVLPEELTSKLRASILLAGPLLARLGKVQFSHPGGDIIGTRTIEPHFEGFKRLGYTLRRDDQKYFFSKGDTPIEEISYFMEEASCTAAENVLLAAVLGDSTFILKNCPIEPQIVDLCNLLTAMGAKIEGVGTQTITVRGVTKLKGADFTIGQDYVEMATYAIAAAITGGEILLKNCTIKDMEPVTLHLGSMGVAFEETKEGIKAYARHLRGTPKLHTNIWPGFPTDLMSATIVLATQAEGVSLLHDWMYESRMFFVDKLISMGAQITIADPHRVLVYGPTPLKARFLETPDIRAGMALVLAALAAQGESTINRIELIERGYENVVENITSLGGIIERVD